MSVQQNVQIVKDKQTEMTKSNLHEDNTLNPAIIFEIILIFGWLLSALIRDYLAEVGKQSIWFVRRFLATTENTRNRASQPSLRRE
jgi:hypothetical protein